MPCLPYTKTHSPTPPRSARRKAALERLKEASGDVPPALVREAQASLASAFSLSDLLFGRPRA